MKKIVYIVFGLMLCIELAYAINIQYPYEPLYRVTLYKNILIDDLRLNIYNNSGNCYLSMWITNLDTILIYPTPIINGELLTTNGNGTYTYVLDENVFKDSLYNANVVCDSGVNIDLEITIVNRSTILGENPISLGIKAIATYFKTTAFGILAEEPFLSIYNFIITYIDIFIFVITYATQLFVIGMAIMVFLGTGGYVALLIAIEFVFIYFSFTSGKGTRFIKEAEKFLRYNVKLLEAHVFIIKTVIDSVTTIINTSINIIKFVAQTVTGWQFGG